MKALPVSNIKDRETRCFTHLADACPPREGSYVASCHSRSRASVLLFAVLGLAAAGAIAGCGGGGGGGNGGGGTTGGNGAYTVALLSPLSNDVSLAPSAINANGHIAASSSSGQSLPSAVRKAHTTNSYVEEAALVVNGTPTALGYPNGTDGSVGLDINSSDTVVGYSVVPTSSDSTALYWPGGTLTTLAGLGGSSKALGINDSGTIVGQSNGLPVYWTGGGSATALSVPNGDTGIAAAINAGGVIVGSVTSNTTTQAAEWQSSSSSPTLLPLPSGATGSEALGINTAGEIVGEATVGGLNVPVEWQNGEVVLLSAPSSGLAQAVNDSGVIVGAITVAGGQHAVTWKNGSLIDLNNQLPTGSGWTLSQANAINNAGEIVGIGNKGGFLLTPGGSGSGGGTPPPP